MWNHWEYDRALNLLLLEFRTNLFLTLELFWLPDWNHPMKAVVWDCPQVQWLSIKLVDTVELFLSELYLNETQLVKIDITNLLCNIDLQP